MSFLDKELKRIEGKKLGRVRTDYIWDEKSQRSERVLVAQDAKDKPRMVVQNAIPVDRTRAVVRPGDEQAKPSGSGGLEVCYPGVAWGGSRRPPR